MAYVLEIENLSKTYGGGEQAVEALRGVSLRAGAGEFVAIMGASGSGKSTLLHLAGGLDLPTSGTVRIESHDLAAMSDAQRTVFRRRRLGVIFQAYNLLPTLSARQNVALPLLVDGAPAEVIERKTDEMLRVVRLQDRTSHLPAALSGGEQQRVAIARALLNDPALILADEPTGNLDSHSAAQIWQLLSRLSHEMGKTVLMVTHEAAGAIHADRVVVLKDGQIVGEFPGLECGDASVVAAKYMEIAG